MRFFHRIRLLGQGDADVTLVAGPWLVNRRADCRDTAACVRVCIRVVVLAMNWKAVVLVRMVVTVAA